MMKGPGWIAVVLVGLALAVLGALYVTAPFAPESEIEADGEGPLTGLGNALGDAAREVTTAMGASPYPARWGGGIRQLGAVTRPFFAALFARLTALGHDPRSNYPHRALAEAGGFRALDIVDNRWPRNGWQSPVEPYITFYRDLIREARALGLKSGADWDGGKWAGCNSAWARAWAPLRMGDMLHVEWTPETGTDATVLDLTEEATS